jgi:hypothetical protein
VRRDGQSWRHGTTQPTRSSRPCADRQPDRFAPTLPDGVVAILCGRASIIPAANDDKVLALGIPFYILENSNPGRLGVLELDQGQFRFRMLAGTLRPEDEQPLESRLNEFKSRLQAR